MVVVGCTDLSVSILGGLCMKSACVSPVSSSQWGGKGRGERCMHVCGVCVHVCEQALVTQRKSFPKRLPGGLPK